LTFPRFQSPTPSLHCVPRCRAVKPLSGCHNAPRDFDGAMQDPTVRHPIHATPTFVDAVSAVWERSINSRWSYDCCTDYHVSHPGSINSIASCWQFPEMN
jgi:hypothetical protein